MWRALQVHFDLRHATRQPFARADVKGNAAPAPVIDVEFNGDKRFGNRVRFNPGLFSIRPHLAFVNSAGAVLPAHREPRDVVDAHWTDGAEHLDLLLADRIGIESDGWFH